MVDSGQIINIVQTDTAVRQRPIHFTQPAIKGYGMNFLLHMVPLQANPTPQAFCYYLIQPMAFAMLTPSTYIAFGTAFYKLQQRHVNTTLRYITLCIINL
jgi:hypothetical protein